MEDIDVMTLEAHPVLEQLLSSPIGAQLEACVEKLDGSLAGPEGALRGLQI